MKSETVQDSGDVISMIPKEINRAAGRIFQATIPPHWAVRSQQDQEDYGIDYEIELTTADDRATGFIFKVQEKGVEAADLIQDGHVLAYRDLSVSRMTYYLTQLRIPVVLVVVDVSAARAYWTVLHGDPTIEAAHREARASNQQTMTVHIPTSSVLPQSAGRLVERVARANDALLVEAVKNVRSDRLLEIAKALGRVEDLSAALNAHKESADCEQIDALVREGKHDEALKRSWDYLESPVASVEMRFEAGLKIIQAASRSAGAAKTPVSVLSGEEYLETRRAVTTKLLRIARAKGTPARVRLFARALCRSVRLRESVDREFGLWMSTLVQLETGDEFTRMMTRSAQNSARLLVLRELRRAHLSLTRLAEGNHWELLPQAWAQIAMDVQVFLASLERGGLAEVASSIAEQLSGFTDLCIQICAKSRRYSELTLCALIFVGLGSTDEVRWAERVQRARDFAGQIEDDTLKREALLRLDEYARLPTIAKEQAAPSLQDEVAMYRTMARSLGVDVDDPKNKIDEVVRIGLLDLNPERALRKCEHLFVSLGSVGIPGQMLGLPTAGMKYLHCTKHGVTLGGLMLDGVSELMSTIHCRNCAEVAPRLANWKWTKGWQQEQHAKWRAFAERVR